MKFLILNSLDERYGSTYRIRPIAVELKKLSHEVIYFEKRKSFFLKCLEMKWLALFSQYDVLMVQKFNPLTFFPILIGKLRGKYVIADWDDWDTGLQKNALFKAITWICEAILPHCPNLITSHNQQLLNMVPSTKRTLLLEQGFDDQLFKTIQRNVEDKKITIGYMCTFTHGGTLDLDDLLKTLSKVNNPHIQFRIIGGGELLEKFMKQADQLKMSNVHFTDHVPHEKIPQILSTLDFGLIYMKDSKANRSRVSFKVIEYLASGVPVIGQMVGDSQKYFGQAILQVPLNELANYLNLLEPGKLPEKTLNHELLKGFTWSNIVFKLHHTILDVQNKGN